MDMKALALAAAAKRNKKVAEQQQQAATLNSKSPTRGVSKTRDLYSDLVAGLVWSYQCTSYIGTSGENPWHHVTIDADKQKDGLATFHWENRAGVEWTLTCDINELEDGNSLEVGAECPYHGDGHRFCQMERDDVGRVVALLGPFGERYDKKIIPITDDKNNKKILKSGRAEKMRLIDTKMSRRVQQKKEEEAAGGDDIVEKARRMMEFTAYLADVAQNIQAIDSSLKGVVSQSRVDDLTSGLFWELKALASKQASIGGEAEKAETAEEADVVVVGEKVTGADSEISDSEADFVEVL